MVGALLFSWCDLAGPALTHPSSALVTPASTPTSVTPADTAGTGQKKKKKKKKNRKKGGAAADTVSASDGAASGGAASGGGAGAEVSKDAEKSLEAAVAAVDIGTSERAEVGPSCSRARYR